MEANPHLIDVMIEGLVHADIEDVTPFALQARQNLRPPSYWKLICIIAEMQNEICDLRRAALLALGTLQALSVAATGEAAMSCHCQHPKVWPDGTCVACGVFATTDAGHSASHEVLAP